MSLVWRVVSRQVSPRARDWAAAGARAAPSAAALSANANAA
jgi:hypothetical protein